MSLLTPPVTPLTGSFAKSQFPDTPLRRHSRQHSHPLTPPYTPESKTISPERLNANRLSIGSSADGWKSTETERVLSDNELSYFLPSRADGVNDMYLHHRLFAPAEKMDRERILTLWALQLTRHPLLASHIRFNTYENVSFVYAQPSMLYTALDAAEDRFVYVPKDSEEHDIIDLYLNGPRSLSKDRLAMLVVKELKELGKYEIMLCATHFLGDGMALHTFMNEFYTLLGSDHTTSAFGDMIKAEIEQVTGIPASLEERMPAVGNGSKFASAIGAVDNRRNDSKLIGGQSFPTNSDRKPRHTVVPTFAYTPEETKRILGACKANGATIAHAMFALCNIAWSRRTENRIDPCLIYSALNLRPNMLPPPPTSSSTSSATSSSYFHLAVGYFNIVLPSLLPSDLSTSELFWYRARATKAQTIKAVKSQFVVARSRNTNKIRRDRAVKWAQIDDEEEEAKKREKAARKMNAGLGLGIIEPAMEGASIAVASTDNINKVPGPKLAPVRAEQATPSPPQPQQASPKAAVKDNASTSVSVLPPASQKALMGVSMLGNLDGMYAHKSYPDLVLESLTTGSRQRPGGLLLFAYTFAGKLWMSLGYDVNGFQPGAIEGFWEEVQSLVKEVLL